MYNDAYGTPVKNNLTILSNLLEAFVESPMSIVYPIHPRTEKRLQHVRLYAKVKQSKNEQMLSPLGYLDFSSLLKNCELEITDLVGYKRKQRHRAYESLSWLPASLPRGQKPREMDSPML